MFEPKFAYTPKIVNELASIERLYGQLTAEKLIPSLALKLSQENLVLATHHSTSIEGNPLNPHDVTNIVLGDQIPVTKSEKEVKNYFVVLNRIAVLAKEHEPISTDLTQKLHLDLMQGLEREGLGKFRNGPVFVGHKTKVEIVVKHNPPFHSATQIDDALKNVYDWLSQQSDIHPLIKAGIFHHEFAYIHPFFDGNGRLARILTTYYLFLKKYEVIKFFMEGIALSLQGSLARINELKQTSLEEIKGEKRVIVSSREEEVLQIVLDKKAIRTSDIQNALSVTRQQAHSLLHSLVKKGLLEKFGKTKTSYYKLADQSNT